MRKIMLKKFGLSEFLVLANTSGLQNKPVQVLSRYNLLNFHAQGTWFWILPITFTAFPCSLSFHVGGVFFFKSHQNSNIGTTPWPTSVVREPWNMLNRLVIILFKPGQNLVPFLARRLPIIRTFLPNLAKNILYVPPANYVHSSAQTSQLKARQ